MANILSQEEIDALMGAIEEDEPDAIEDVVADEESLLGTTTDPKSGSSVVPYDFRRPNRSFFREQLRIFQTIHDAFARQYAQSLSGYLRSMVEIEFITADQISYGEYILSLPGSTSLFIFDILPLEGRGVIEMNPGLVLSMVDRLFGGVGAESDFTRDLTDIETAVMTRLIERGLALLVSAWDGIVTLDPHLKSRETKPAMMQLMPSSESVVLITFELRTQNTSGTLSLCYPYSSMEPIIPRISNNTLIRRRGEADDLGRRWIHESLQTSRIPLVAELGRTQIKVRDFLDLKVGDVMVLDGWVQNPLDLRIGQEVKAKVRPGLQGKHRVVQVEELIAQGGAADEFAAS